MEEQGPSLDNPELFKNKLNEWIRLKKQLAEAKKDIAVLSKREKELKQEVGDTMSKSGTDRVNLSTGAKVNFRERTSKGGVTKDVIAQGIKVAFPNNETEQERVLQCIEDCRKDKTVRSVTLTGLK